MSEQNPVIAATGSRTKTRKMVIVSLILLACLMSLLAVILMAEVVAHSLFRITHFAVWLPQWTPAFAPLGIALSVVGAVVQFTALRLGRGTQSRDDAHVDRAGVDVPGRFVRELSTGFVCLMLAESLAAGAATAIPLNFSAPAAAPGSSTTSQLVEGSIVVFPPLPGGANRIVFRSDGSVWFLGAASYGRYNPSGKLSAFQHPNVGRQ